MAIKSDVTINGGITVPGAYIKLVTIQSSRIQGIAEFNFLAFKDEEERRRSGGSNFDQISVKLPQQPTKEETRELEGVDGKPVNVVTQKAIDSYSDVVNKPLSTWIKVPDGVTTAQELLDHLTFNQVECALAYGVAKNRREFAGATDV